VTGIDLNLGALAKARRHAPDNPCYLKQDMRQLAEVPGTFDALVCLWQSFGYFEAASNLDILKQMRAKLNPRGRLVLDIYHRGFFEQHLGQQRVERDGHTIIETKTMAGDRLRVALEYGRDYPADVFEWQLYTPDEICALARSVGLAPRLTCTRFDPTQPASANQPRLQIVFEVLAL
jgi:SAM-dependent methyltransferase